MFREQGNLLHFQDVMANFCFIFTKNSIHLIVSFSSFLFFLSFLFSCFLFLAMPTLSVNHVLKFQHQAGRMDSVATTRIVHVSGLAQ